MDIKRMDVFYKEIQKDKVMSKPG